MSYLDDYKTYTSSLEVPEIFNVWCALSSLAAAAQRKIWLDMGLFKICSNLYIILDSPPGKCGKSTAMNVVRELLAPIQNIHTKSDSITKEKIFESMESAVEQYIFPGSTIKALVHSSLTIFANEMSLLIKKGDKDFVSALNSLFDSLSVFKHSTKTRGENIIINPFLNILGGTTPDWVSTNIHEDVIEGGLSARTIFVYSSTPSKRNPFPSLSVEGRVAGNRLLSRLEQIVLIGGEFRWDSAAKDLYSKWHDNHYLKPFSHPTMGGYHDRKRVHLLKVAMLMSLSYKDELVLLKEDIQQAMAILQITEPGIEMALRGVGRNVLSNIAQDMLKQISDAGSIPLSRLLQDNYWRVSKQEFEDVLSSLKQMKFVDVGLDKGEVVVRYIKDEQP